MLHGFYKPSIKLHRFFFIFRTVHQTCLINEHQLLQFTCVRKSLSFKFQYIQSNENGCSGFLLVNFNFCGHKKKNPASFVGKALFCQIGIQVIAGCCIIWGCSCQSMADLPLVLHFMRVYIRHVSSSGKLFSAWCQQVDSLESQHNLGNHSSLQLEILIIYILSRATVEFIVWLSNVFEGQTSVANSGWDGCYRRGLCFEFE